MNQHQREHIATVMAHLSEPARWLARSPQEQLIGDSWQRCVTHHGLEPGRMQEARILPWQQLREHRQRMEEFRHIAHHGLTQLYQQIAAAGYVLLLTDASGITVDYLGDAHAEVSLRRAGLFLGAEWTEAVAGTCAVGTALATGRALTVHQTDHFDATHIPLTCSAVPLFDPEGQLQAILDISALSSPQPRASQHLALQLAQVWAARIENAWFAHRHQNNWTLQLSAGAPFVGGSPEFLIAFDDRGLLAGHNHRGQCLLEGELGLSAPPPGDKSALLGMPIERLFNTTLDCLPQWLAGGQPATLDQARSGDKLFVTAVAPLRPARRAAHASADRHAPCGVADRPAAHVSADLHAAREGAVLHAARGVANRPAAHACAELPAPLAALCGGDAALHQQLQRAARLLSASLNLVVQGETGSGKEYFARAFHQASDRRARPFIAVNCAAIPAQLIESELFGHLPGSFSGAGSKARAGLIQAADGGTLFLDEIGDMPLEMQTRLLRVLAEKEVLPVGGTRPVRVDIRVISASHHRLEQRVEQGHFRADLFWRLQGARVTLPALRDRSDLDWLIDTLLDGKAELAPAARRCVQQHRWPGNLRELRNALDYASAMSLNGRIEPADLPDTLQMSGQGIASAQIFPRAAAAHDLVMNSATSGASQQGPLSYAGAADHPAAPATGHAGASGHGAAAACSGQKNPPGLPPEAQELEQHLHAARWNHSAVARLLGISRMTLYRRMQRYGIRSPLHRS
ncbi:sigma-54-dependent Fis family transcriptional regulator [Erwinia sp. Leaf53]|uniref:sigma-54-dependent Fis family transcriptional regulator n=1 Tax=Erwinia sp. Leaf53 TaxID=1736225 RepID=UPI0006FFEFC8|nr:sigma-54-dependent Fis family transcriptional regulator [Erwinia sp. Leaf53]KQN63570.1 AAA family ATPase [Erwinia sp. Leaf53]